MALATPGLVDKTARFAGPAWYFDRERGFYVSAATRRSLTGAQVRAAVEAMVAGAKSEARAVTRAALSGEVDLLAWEGEMRSLIEALHLAAARAGGGTTEAMGRAGVAVMREQAYLTGMLADMGEATVEQVGKLENRAASYMDAGRVTFEQARFEQHAASGFASARRVLHPEAEHCTGCVEWARLGWMPLAMIAPIGSQECGQWCECGMEYSRSRWPE